MAQIDRVAGVDQIITRAIQKGVDPLAALAVAHSEGLGGGIGDSGTSFGPFQLHWGGAYPASAPHERDAAQAWAWSTEGINYAVDRIASVAKGLTGPAAVSAIVTRFERPADPQSEVANSVRTYNGYKSDPKMMAQLQTGWPGYDSRGIPVVGETAAEKAAGSLQSPLTGAGNAIGDVGGKIVDATGLGGVKDFLTSWRFAEVVGGFLLLIVGLILLGRHFGIRPPVPGPIGAAATGVDSTFQFAPGERDYAASQPTSRPARARTERVSLPADRPAARRPAVRTADSVPY